MSQKKMLNLQDSLQTIKDPNLRSWHPFTQIKNCAVSNNWRLKRKLNSWKWNCRIVSWTLPGLQLYLKLILTDQQCRARDLTLSSRGWSRWRLVVGGETKKNWMLIFCRRKDQDKTVSFFASKTRPRGDLSTNFGRDGDQESLRLFLQDWDENQLLTKKKIQYITTHPVQDETKMRLREIEETEMTQRWDCLKILHPRQVWESCPSLHWWVGCSEKFKNAKSNYFFPL